MVVFTYRPDGCSNRALLMVFHGVARNARTYRDDARAITEKYGGLHNASAYIGMMLRHKLGIVILGNRAKQYPSEVGRRILLELAPARGRRA